MDALAAADVRFTNYYATDTPCLPGRTAVFLGQFGIRTRVMNHGRYFADLVPLKCGTRLPELSCHGLPGQLKDQH